MTNLGYHSWYSGLIEEVKLSCSAVDFREWNGVFDNFPFPPSPVLV